MSRSPSNSAAGGAANPEYPRAPQRAAVAKATAARGAGIGEETEAEAAGGEEEDAEAILEGQRRQRQLFGGQMQMTGPWLQALNQAWEAALERA